MEESQKLTPKLHSRQQDGKTYYFFWCPGCKQCHLAETPRWTFNGNVEKPTFGPSILLTATNPASDYRCHLFIIDGQLHYCGDCNHNFKGQIVEMQDIPEDYYT